MEMFAVTQSTILIRLTVAMFLGLLIGAERSRVGKRAGMRTYGLVSLGACLFVVMSGMVAFSAAENFTFDPLRVASQIVVGIGFLGAGVIFVQKNELTGLTTAAGLWVAAAVGASTGYGLYVISSYVTLLTLVVFEVMWYVEAHFIRTAKAESSVDIISKPIKSSRHDENEG